MLLENSERFQKEYREFTETINKINDERVKSEISILLNRLLSAVRDIDRRHADITMSRTKLPTSVGETKDTITELRKKIQTRIQECRRAGFLK
jgi:prefoldin subunit 5